MHCRTHTHAHASSLSDWYATFSKLAGVDPTDEYTDPATGLTHDIDGVDVFPAILAADATTREWLPTTHKSLLWDDTKSSGKMWKLVQGNETQAVRFYKNGTNYADPHNACLQPVWKQFDCTNSVGQGGGGGRQSCVVCTNKEPCLFDVKGDEGETMNVAKQNPAVVATMQAKLATYATPYVPESLTEAELSCYNCSKAVHLLYKNFSGPGCIAKT